MQDKQLEAILSRLEKIEERLSRLESPAPNPPPILNKPATPNPQSLRASRRTEAIRQSLLDPPTTQPQPKNYPSSPSVKPLPPTTDQTEKQPREGFEYSIGAKLLPLAGAALTILAIIYFTTEAFKNGWITSQMIFGGTVALCLAFIGVGQYLRNEKEQFGQILTGIGSCGLYITFAAGHFAQNLYPSTAMLGLFMGLSLVNLGYGYWKGSTAFLRIGVTGGFTAAYLPLVQPNPQIETHFLLHALIVIPATLIIARHKWLTDAMLFLPSAVAVTIPALWIPGSEWLKVAALSLTALMSAFAYSRSYKHTEFDPKAAYLPLTLAAIAWINFEIRDSYPGSAHIILFGIAIYALSRFKFSDTVVRGLQFSALTIPLILAPWGATKVESTFILAAIAIILSWLGNRTQNRLLQGLSAVEASLAIAAYIVATAQEKIQSWQLEVAILSALLIAGVYALQTITKAFSTKEQNLALGGTTLSLLALRFLTLIFTKTPAALEPYTAFLISFVIIATLLHALGNIISSVSLKFIASIASFASLTTYLFIATANPPFGQMVVLGFVMLASSYYLFRLYWVETNAAKDSAVIAIILPGAAIIAHLVYLTLTHPLIHAVPETAIVWGILIATIPLRFLAHRLKINDLKSVSYATLGLTLTAYTVTRLSDPTHILWAESTLILSLLALIGYFARLDWDRDQKVQNYIFAFIGTPVTALTFWLIHIVQTQGLGRNESDSLVLSGVLVSCALCASLVKKPWPSLLAPAWIAFLLASFAVFLSGPPTLINLILILVAQLSLAVTPEKFNPGYSSHRYLHLVLTIFIVSSIGNLVLSIPSSNPSASPAVTATWTALSVIFLITGFAARITEVRHAGLALLFLSGAKLILIDLSETAEFIRVAVTLGLGLAMIGGGYLYIKLQNRLEPAPTTVPTNPGQPSQEPGN